MDVSEPVVTTVTATRLTANVTEIQVQLTGLQLHQSDENKAKQKERAEAPEKFCEERLKKDEKETP